MKRVRLAVQLGFHALVLITIGVSIYAIADAVRAPVRIEGERIAAFEGVWAGRENLTPLGPIPFVLDFRREEDGSLHSHSAMSSETWVDLRFHRGEGGTWLLTEAASLAGTGVQEYTMHPARVSGDTLFYAYAEDPEFLNCRMFTDGEKLTMLVHVRGREHVRFLLSRVTGEQAAALQAELESNRSRSGAGDLERFRRAAEGGDPVEVRDARIRVLSKPDDPQLHLALAGALSRAMAEASGMKTAAYAQEMYTALQTAVALDPVRPDAHYALAQYYLTAPPIAGGSTEAAEAEAAELHDLGSPLGEVLSAQLELRRGQRERAAERLRTVLDEHPDLAAARRLYIEVAGQSGTSP